MELFPISDEEVNSIHKKYNTSRKKIEENVTILKEWLAKQPHLPQKLPYEHFLEKVFANCKYRVEHAKEKIESHFTLKNANKEYFRIFESPNFILPSKNSVSIYPLPKLGPDYERIYVAEVKTPDASDFHMDHFTQMVLAVLELTYRYDKCMSLRMIIDCRNFNFDYLRKVDISTLHRLATLDFEGYSCKIEGFDLVYANAAVQLMLSIVKAVLRDKIFKKIVAHSDLESLHRSISKKYLPEKLGGTLGPCEEIKDKLDGVILENKQFLADTINYVTDESLRIGSCPHSQLFGLEGTFKKLCVD